MTPASYKRSIDKAEEFQRLNIRRGPAPLAPWERWLLAAIIALISLEIAYHFTHWLVAR